MSHHSLWRRFQWRYRTHWLVNGGIIFAMSIEVSCVLLWLLPRWEGTPVAQIARWLWFLFCLSLLFMMGLGLLTLGLAGSSPVPLNDRSSYWRQNKGITGLTFVLQIVGLLAALIALGIGRVDWAIECIFGSRTLHHLVWSWSFPSLWHLLLALADLLIFFAVPLHTPMLAFTGFGFSPFAKWLARTDWERMVARKSTKKAYAQTLIQQHREHPIGSRSTTLLDNLSKMKMWPEAEEEFQRLKRANVLKEKDKILWEARLAAGQEHLEEAVRIATESKLEAFEDLTLLLAKVYAEQGKREKALQMIAGIRPRWPSYGLGDVYAALRDYETALTYYERTARIGKNYELLSHMAFAIMAAGEDRDAIFVFKQAILATPYIATEDLRNLALCCQRTGNERGMKKAEALAVQGEL